MGTAPSPITTLVCSDVPDAMLVRAHAASNCRPGLSCLCREKRTHMAHGAFQHFGRPSSPSGSRASRTHLEELDEARHDTGLDHVLDGRVLLDRQQLAELRRGLQLQRGVVRHDAGHHLRQVLQALGQRVVSHDSTTRRRGSPKRAEGRVLCSPQKVAHKRAEGSEERHLMVWIA